MRPLLFAICAAAALSPLAAAAATPQAESAAAADARCLMAMAAFAGSSDQNTARTAQAGVIYFAGRIKAEDPTYDFSVRLKTLTGMTPQVMQTEAQQRCGPMLLQAMRELDAAQQALAPPKPATNAAKPQAAAPPGKH